MSGKTFPSVVTILVNVVWSKSLYEAEAGPEITFTGSSIRSCVTFRQSFLYSAVGTNCSLEQMFCSLNISENVLSCIIWEAT